MVDRQKPWIPSPDRETYDALVAAVSSTRMFLVQDLGPTQFLIAVEGDTAKFKVSLGSLITCSCKSRGKPCLHSLFVMHKVFRVPTDNPLCWQQALIDPEIEKLIRGRFNSDVYVNRRKKSTEVASDAPAEVPQKDISEDDSCPICMESLHNSDHTLDWCRGGCGNSLHEECLRVWAQHKKSTGEDNTCPLCRCKWRDRPKLSSAAASAARAIFTGSHPRTKCMVCKASPIAGIRYRCVTCVDYDMCSSCFAGPRHREHPFVQRESPAHDWQAAARPSEVAAALAAVALDLQGRDLSPADYDMLLSLDNPASRALHSHLVTSLPDAPTHAPAAAQTMCVFCETPVHGSSAAAAANPKKLPCNRLCHVQCVESAVAHGELSCPHCSMPLFAGLRPRPSRRRSAPAVVETAASAPQPAVLSMSVTGSHINSGAMVTAEVLATSPILRPVSHEQPLRRPQRLQHLPVPSGSIARDLIRLRNRDPNATVDRSSGLDLRVGASTQPLPTQFPVVQRFNETHVAIGGRTSAIILESSARARDLMRRQQSEALRQLHRPGEPFSTVSLAIEANSLPVSSALSAVTASGHMLPPLPPKKLKDAANRSGIRPSQLKAGMAQASLARGLEDTVAAPSTPSFLVEADGIAPSTAAAQRSLLRPSSIAQGGGAAPDRR